MSGFERKLARSQGGAATGNVSASGLAAPFMKQTVARPDGATAVQLSIDVTNVPSPSRSYSADAATVIFNGSDALHFVFWQHTVARQPRSMVAVKMYAGAAHHFFRSCEPLSESLETFVQRNSAVVSSVDELPTEPPQSVSLVASLAQVAFAGYEAEVGFFHMSPYAVHTATRNDHNQIPIEPVVKIDLSATVLLSILRRFKDLLPSLPAESQ